MPQFLQIHTLTSYPASLLNRDDVGFAKRIPFGDSVRTRVSSQCLKRHWRTFDGDEGWHGISGAEMSVRSRRTFENHIVSPLIDDGVDPAVARAVGAALLELVLGSAPKEGAALESGQVTVLGLPELRYLREEAASIAQGIEAASAKKLVAEAKKATKQRAKDRDWKKNLHEMKRAAGLDAALFGRMVTSDVLAAGDASIHVAHAFTVHGRKSESDYFSAVDELSQAEGEAGSGHINSTELTSGVFYGYVAVDFGQLVSNLEGCPPSDWGDANLSLAREVIGRFVRLVATVSPGAKRGSTAPYAYAHLVALEHGPAQPRTFANAFLDAVRPTEDPIRRAYEKLAVHLGELDGASGAPGERASHRIGAGAEELEPAFGAAASLDALSAWAGERLGAA
ncbi:MAG: type I-E CRISPR-associated protein Cas7/Cse4/CasC [Sandaracinaceae bacterium]